MKSVRVVTDLDECRDLWQMLVPAQGISTRWDVRYCFHREYGHLPYFVVCEDKTGICGLLPLSWNEELGAYHFFPGETWAGKTWLEQNPLIADSPATLELMLSIIPGDYQLRYLAPSESASPRIQTVDEIGYYFLPPSHAFSMDAYYATFSHKFIKRLKKDVDAFYQRGVEIRIDHWQDYALMVDMNLSKYGDQSYFFDQRFARAFDSLFGLLRRNGWLRLVTVLVGGCPAAVDLGCIYSGTYTLLAGGTDAAYRGIAKLINLHHMQFACEQRFDSVDFLCGDFNWKSMFHLSPRPLYLLEAARAVEMEPAPVHQPVIRTLYSLRRSVQLA